MCNELPEEVVDAGTITMFKRHLDGYMNRKGSEGYGLEADRHYLGAMAVAVIIFDLILRHIPVAYREEFYFLRSIPVCNVHAILLYAATDGSVCFTVTFTFERFVAICCQKLK
eukprot:g31562.t1